MKYRALGASGLKVSPICLGTLMFGSRTDEAEAARIVGSARDTGINFIDTAVSYAGGRSEAILGDVLASDRDWWVIATKVGSRTGDGPNEDGTSRHHVQASIERSLRRLRTDHVDLYYLHRDDGTTPLRESLQAVGDLNSGGQGALPRPVELPRLAACRGRRDLPGTWHPGADRPSALLPRPKPPAGGRAPPRGRPFRPRCHPLQSTRARHPHWQVPSRRGPPSDSVLAETTLT